MDQSFEPGFLLFFNILRTFDASHTVMFFIMSLATYSVLYIAIKRYTHYVAIAVIVFLLIPGLYLNSLSIIRQSFAIVVSFSAFYFLINKKYLTYVLLMFLAFSFHYSSVVIIIFHIMALLFAKKITPIYYFIIIILSIIASFLNVGNNIAGSLLGASKYIVHLENAEGSVSIIKILILNSIILIPLFFYKKICVKEANKYVFFFSVLAIIIVNTFSSLIIITRLSYYFRIFEIILIAELIYFSHRKWRPILLLAVFLIYLTMFIGSLQNDIKAESHGQPKMIPYNSVFSK